MRGLLGDRFLRRFTGDLKHGRKHQNSTGEGQNPEADVASAQGPEAAGADTSDAPIKAEPNKRNEIEPKAD